MTDVKMKRHPSADEVARDEKLADNALGFAMRDELSVRNPFLAKYLLNVNRRYDREQSTSMDISPSKITLNPDILAKQDREVVVGGYTKGMWHMALGNLVAENSPVYNHPNTEETYQKENIWRLAQEFQVNAMAIGDNFIIPGQGYTNSDGHENQPFYDRIFDDHTTKSVYYQLLKDAQEPPPEEGGDEDGDSEGSGSESGEGGDASGPGTPTRKKLEMEDFSPGGKYDFNGGAEGDTMASLKQGSEDDEDMQEMKDQVGRSLMDAKKECGDERFVGDMILDELFKPRVDWTAALKNWAFSWDNTEWNFSRRSRRGIDEASFMPARHNQSMGEVTVLVDTSGSVSADEFKMIMSEVDSVRRRLLPKKLTLIQYSVGEVGYRQDIGRDDDITQLKFFGGGGTDVLPVWEDLREEKPEILLLFSDMYMEMPERRLRNTKVMCGVINNPDFEAPKGLFDKVIHIEL